VWIGSDARPRLSPLSTISSLLLLLLLLLLLQLTLLLLRQLTLLLLRQLTLLLLTLLLPLRLLLLLRLRLNHSPPWRRKRQRRRSYQYLRKLFQDFHSHEKTDLPIIVLQLSE
jgi:hypothetical protein